MSIIISGVSGKPRSLLGNFLRPPGPDLEAMVREYRDKWDKALAKHNELVFDKKAEMAYNYTRKSLSFKPEKSELEREALEEKCLQSNRNAIRISEEIIRIDRKIADILSKKRAPTST